MEKFRVRTLFLTLALISPALLAPVVQMSAASYGRNIGAAPYSIDIQPTKTSAKVGESITYKLKVSADPGFSSPIKFELTITAMGFGVTLDLGTQNPPYPKEFEQAVKLPENIPVDVTAKGVLKATSGSSVVEKEVEITISKSGSSEGLLDWIIRTLQDIWRRILSIFGL